MKDNRRVRMTKKLMKDALLELLEQHPLNRITVTDVCRSADVNRSTFYAYYTDVETLMLEIEDDVLAQLPDFPEGQDIYSDDSFLHRLQAFFDYVRANERLFRIMIVVRDNDSFNQRLVRTVTEHYLRGSGAGDSLAARYTYIYCVSGVIGVIKTWIVGGFPMDAHTFAQMVLHLSAKVTG